MQQGILQYFNRLVHAERIRTVPCALLCAILVLAGAISESAAQSSLNRFWQAWSDGQPEHSLYRVASVATSGGSGKINGCAAVRTDLVTVPVPHAESGVLETGKIQALRRSETRWQADQATFHPGAALTRRTLFSPLLPWTRGGSHLPAILPFSILVQSEIDSAATSRLLLARREGFVLTGFDSARPAEEERREIPFETRMISEDDLALRVRELVAPFPGGDYLMLPSLASGEQAAWQRVFVRRVVARRKVRDETTDVALYSVRSDSREIRYTVEEHPPKRVIGWQIYDSQAKVPSEEGTLLAHWRGTETAAPDARIAGAEVNAAAAGAPKPESSSPNLPPAAERICN